MLTEKDYCDYETCVALKESGFDEYCSGYIDSLCKKFIETRYLKNWNNSKHLNFEVFSCPSLYEAQKWLKEEKKIHITIFSQSQESWQYRITKPHQKLEEGLHGEDFYSFEEALSAGIKGAIKLLKEEK